MSWRRVVRGTAVYVGASLVTVLAAAQASNGWRTGATEEPLPLISLGPADAEPFGQVDRREVIVPRRDGTTAAAWLVTVRGAEAAMPGVVLLAGAGPASRDSQLATAEALAAHGIAVLVADKRAEASDWLHRDFDLLADDAAAAVEGLVTQSAVDPRRIGIVGFSEGGWVATLAVGRSPSVGFLALASAPIVTPLVQAAWLADSRLTTAPDWVRRLPATVLAGGRGLVDYLEADPTSALARLRVPVYAVWGAADRAVPVASAIRMLTDNSAAPVSAVVLLETGHDLHGQKPGPEWSVRMAGWIRGLPHTATESVSGVQPTSMAGAPVPPHPAWYLLPAYHLLAGAALATAASFLPVRTRKRVQT